MRGKKFCRSNSGGMKVADLVLWKEFLSEFTMRDSIEEVDDNGMDFWSKSK